MENIVHATITAGPTGSLGEAVEQRRESLARLIDPPAFDAAETVELRGGRQDRAYAAADRIIASDREVGCDPDALRAEIERLCGIAGLLRVDLSIALRERDEVRAEVERLTALTDEMRAAETILHKALEQVSSRLRECLEDYEFPQTEDEKVALATVDAAIAFAPARGEG